MRTSAVIGMALSLAGCTGQQSSWSAVSDCTQRGIAYFKEIESWPTLTDGRDAASVAAERCSRTTTAFP